MCIALCSLCEGLRSLSEWPKGTRRQHHQRAGVILHPIIKTEKTAYWRKTAGSRCRHWSRKRQEQQMFLVTLWENFFVCCFANLFQSARTAAGWPAFQIRQDRSPVLLIFHSKAARFSFAPKCSHELALTCTGQNINGAMDDGLIMKPELR